MSTDRFWQEQAGDRPDTDLDDALHRLEAQVGQGLDQMTAVIKPRLRGWLHAGTFPLAVTVGVLLIALSPDGRNPRPSL